MYRPSGCKRCWSKFDRRARGVERFSRFPARLFSGAETWKERGYEWEQNERERKTLERFDARRECSVREGWTLNGEIKRIVKKKKQKETFNRIAPLVYRQNATLSKDVQSEKDGEEKKIILTRTWNRKGVVPWSGETESRRERQARKTRLVIHNPPPVEKILSVSRVSSPD